MSESEHLVTAVLQAADKASPGVPGVISAVEEFSIIINHGLRRFSQGVIDAGSVGACTGDSPI